MIEAVCGTTPQLNCGGLEGIENRYRATLILNGMVDTSKILVFET